MKILKNKKVIKELNTFIDFLEYLNSIEKNPIKKFSKLESWYNKNKNNSFSKTNFNYKNIQKDIFGKSIQSHFSIDYWIQRGYTKNEAEQKVKEIQKNNSNKNIEKIKSLSKEEYNKIYATSSKEYFQHKYGKNWEYYYKEYNKNRTNKSLKNKVEYWINKGFSKDEAEQKVKEIQSQRSKKAKEKLKKGEYFIPTQLQYWINKGFSEDEAKLKLSERQSTFSLDNLIKKYGEKEGKEIFNKRQQIWQENYQKTCIQKYGVPFYILSNEYSKLSPITKPHHKEIIDFIKENYDDEILINTKKVISPLELDIYIPDLKFAIEFNGLYYHSNIDKNYHLIKTEKCEEKDIHLFHIFENEWNNNIQKEIWKSKILYKLNKIKNKIYARNCIIKEISKDEELKFLELNHLQGWIPSKIKLGMFHNNELVSVLTVGKNRFKKDEYELLRFASKNYSIVIGAFSKFLKYLKKYNLPNLISYGNRRWTYKNNIYSNFKLIDITKPNYFYFKNNKLYNRLNFQKYKLKNILKNYNEKLSEIDNMLNNGYRIIYDCGNFKYKIF
jgi:hypothetical protein